MPPMLYLIDGHALAYRTYFALNPSGTTDARWVTSSGESTAGIYGFASVLMRILEQEKPDYIAVAFDTGRTFRHEVFPEYKGTRAKMPDDLKVQIERIRQMVDAFNIPRLEVENFEADDVLGTIAKQAEEKGLGVKIITGDRDLLQLVTDRILVNLAGSKLSEAKDYNPEGVLAYLGVRPDQVVDYKAMVGDKSDNIPGVAGIGEKTAIELLLKYQTLDEIYLHLEELKPGVKTKLEIGKEMAYKSQDLARIRTDVQVSLELERAHATDFEVSKVEELFRQLEFRTLMPKVKTLSRQSLTREPIQQLNLFNEPVTILGDYQPTYNLNTRIIRTADELRSVVLELAQAELIALDTETTSTDPMQAKLVGISLAILPGEGIYIPVGHTADPTAQLSLEEVAIALLPIFQNPVIRKAGHNLKYDALVLKRHGLPISPFSFDTMLAEWLVNPASRNLGLKNLAWVRLGIEMTHIEDLIGKGKNQVNMADVEIAKAAPYAAADAEVTLRLIEGLQKDLEKHHALELFHNIEMPLVQVLMEMEEIGIMVDRSFFENFARELQDRIHRIEIEIQEAAGTPFNLNSTQQLSRILFETLKLSPPNMGKKTSAGTYSTSADVLDNLRGQHPVIDQILEYRELSKIKSTYVDALPLQINPVTGRIHTSYNQTGSVTGRIASTDPNLQNIPTRTETGRRVREGFIAAPGNVLLSVDYSQIELRIVAHMANDEAMLAAFKAGLDIHAATAAAIFNISLGEVTRDQRRHAKAINFGLIYGMGAFGLSRSADLTLGEAENFIKEYFMEFPGVKKYLDGIRRQAAEIGYVETLLGRRRYFPGLATQTNQNLKQREEREAINAPIQGTAADIIKLAMLPMTAKLKEAGLSARMLLQVHDELVFECKLEELEATAKVVQNVMESAFTLNIPISTEAKSGTHWGAMKALETKN
jgi:DNA polymerase I